MEVAAPLPSTGTGSRCQKIFISELSQLPERYSVVSILYFVLEDIKHITDKYSR